MRYPTLSTGRMSKGIMERVFHVRCVRHRVLIEVMPPLSTFASTRRFPIRTWNTPAQNAANAINHRRHTALTSASVPKRLTHWMNLSLSGRLWGNLLLTKVGTASSLVAFHLVSARPLSWRIRSVRPICWWCLTICICRGLDQWPSGCEFRIFGNGTELTCKSLIPHRASFNYELPHRASFNHS